MKRLLLVPTFFIFAGTANALTLSVDLIGDSGDRNATALGQSATFNADASGVRFRLGTATIESNRLEFSFASYNVSEDGEFGVNNEWDLGMDYIVTFNPQPIIPFIKFGIGIGQADTDAQFVSSSGETTDNINNINANFGAGLSYKLANNISLTGSAAYIVRRWQPVETVSTSGSFTTNRRDNVMRFGIGLGYTF